MLALRQIGRLPLAYWMSGRRKVSKLWIIGFLFVFTLSCVNAASHHHRAIRDEPDVGGADSYHSARLSDGYVREIRDVKRFSDGVKHYDKIPQPQPGSVKHGTVPPPDESEDEFESIEGSRQAFIEILNEHAKRPHRRRSLKRHNGKIQLIYDFKTKSYKMIEEQSEEW